MLPGLAPSVPNEAFPSLALVDRRYVTSQNTAVTFTDVPMGPVDKLQKFFTLHGFYGTIFDQSLASVKVNGITVPLRHANPGYNEHPCALYAHEFEAGQVGATATIVVTWPYNIWCTHIGVFAGMGFKSLVPVAVSHTAASSGNPMTLNINTPKDGFALGVATGKKDSNYNWTGITKAYDQSLNGMGSSAALFGPSPADGNKSFVCDPTNADVNWFVAASWR